METSHVFVEEEHEDSSLALEQLATHIPDMVLFRSYQAPVPQTNHCYGVIMFLDVSGFTALCENYCSEGKSKHDGADQLTSTLNQYLSQIVQAILEAEGDILKFAGDAILAFWQCSRFAAPDIVHHVLQQSLMMQSDFDNYRTQDGALLRMKIGLSVGTADIHYIGRKDFKTFDITGECVDDASIAQSVTRPGTVVLSKMAWEMCNKQSCFFRLVGHGCAMVSKYQSTAEEESRLSESVGTDVRRSTLGTVLQSVVNYGRPLSSLSTREKEQQSKVSEKRASIASQVERPFGRGLCFRTGVSDHLKTVNKDAQDYLRSYVLRVVVHKIDHGQDVSWLSELREVSVLFINLDPGKKTQPCETQSLLQQSFDVIYPALTKFDGLLNKVFMFDKGCTFLCVFGLPHAKHEDDAARALKTARQIFNDMNHLQLKKYSVGVTTGVAFCGVVGHPQRHDYTVIGQKVNMAARLMMTFPDSVVCDESTRAKSGLATNQFTLQPPVNLKGITNPENVYSFLTESHHIMDGHHSDVHDHTDADDLIGREKEMSLFMEELRHVSEHTHRDPGIIVMLGSGGLGKTKLLRAMKARAAEMGFRVVSGVGGLVEQSTPFFTVKTLITRLLELDTCKNIHDREQLILEHIQDENTRQLLPLLNDILVLKFPQTQTTLHMHHEERTKVLHKLLYSIIHEEALSKPCVFGIDDAHWVDTESWGFLQDLALDPNAILVMTTRPLAKTKKQSNAMMEILNHPHTKILQLEGLCPDDMITLACNLINVHSLPEPLQQIIRERSHGVPMWCEELVETMVELQYLKIIEEPNTILEEEEEESGMSLPDLVGTAVAVSSSARIRRKRKVVLKASRRRSSCQMSSGIGIADIPIPDSVAGMVLTRIDHMSATEQMILKCAAILGTTFTRTMLKAIVPNYSQASFHDALNTLAQAGIIECAIAAEVMGLQADLQTRSKDHLPMDSQHHCPCLTKESHLEHSLNHTSTTLHAKDHPPVDQCEMLQFVHAYVQETAYGLWIESQRTSLHESSALYLESQAHKCTNCGGGGFLAGFKKSMANPAPNKEQNRRGSARPGTARGSLSTQNKLRRMSARRSSTAVEVFGSSSDLRERRPSTAPYLDVSQNLDPLTALEISREQEVTSGVRYNSIGEVDIFGIDVQDCHCDEVLAHVYPQLVRHWRAARDIDKTVEYLIESASAAVATFNNMEALAFIKEVRELFVEYGGKLLSANEQIKMESISGQALLQCGEVEESISHLQQALRLLNTHLPTKKACALISIMFQGLRQWLHVKFPRRFMGRQRGGDFLERARCMTLLVHAYQLQNSDIYSFMVALRQLNTVEEAEEDIHELVEAYTTVIEGCHALHFLTLSNYYTEKALSRCTDIHFGLEDLATYVHLLNVALDTKLCLGKMNDALELGVAARRIAGQMHDVSMEMITLPLLLYVQLFSLKMEDCKETLREICDLASEADDLRAQAVYDCCHFDLLLDAGVGVDEVERLLSSAEMSCEEDVYHFDEIERFFLVSCLALWHARKRQTTLARKYAAIASELQLVKFTTYLSLRGLVRYTECCLLLWKLTAGKPEHKTEAKKAAKRLGKLTQKYPVVKSRYFHLKAYMNYMNGSQRKARKCIASALCTAEVAGLKYEAAWATRSREEWFGNTNTTTNTQAFETIPFFVFH